MTNYSLTWIASVSTEGVIPKKLAISAKSVKIRGEKIPPANQLQKSKHPCFQIAISENHHVY